VDDLQAVAFICSWHNAILGIKLEAFSRGMDVEIPAVRRDVSLFIVSLKLPL